MLGSSFFDNDPFFAGHREHMWQMEQMFPMPGAMGGMMALPDSRRHRQQQQQRAQNIQVADRSLFMDPFAHFNSMFSMMNDMRRAFDMNAVNGSGGRDGMVYQQSSFMSYSNSGDGAPKYYQASSSSRCGPDGVVETNKTERDSVSGVDRIAVGHHIRDRGHVIERSRNNKTGEMNENQDYINLEEEEAHDFEREYRDKWHGAVRGIDHGRHATRTRPVGGTTRSRYAALPEPEPRRHRKTSHRKD